MAEAMGYCQAPLRGYLSQPAAVSGKRLARFSPMEKAAFAGINRDKSR
jgi:hypothetical protein